MFYIYKITNNINGKIYIGQTNNMHTRWLGHCRVQKGRKLQPIDVAIQKYGKENFSIEQIDTSDTREEINIKEIYWISKLDSQNRSKGYNILPGGKCFDVYSNLDSEGKLLWKKINSEAHLGSRPYNNGEICIKLRNNDNIPEGFIPGYLPGKKLKPMSIDTKQKISNAIKEKYKDHNYKQKVVMAIKNTDRSYAKTDAYKNKLSLACKGHKVSKETRDKISSKLKGIKRISHNKKKVLCVENNVVYNSYVEAANSLNISNNISNVIDKENRVCGGYHWRSVNEDSK